MDAGTGPESTACATTAFIFGAWLFSRSLLLASDRFVP